MNDKSRINFNIIIIKKSTSAFNNKACSLVCAFGPIADSNSPRAAGT